MVESAGRSIRVLTGVYLAAILLFVLAPLLVVAGVSFTGGDYVTFPPQGFSLRWYEAVFNSSVYVLGVGCVAQVGLLRRKTCL